MKVTEVLKKKISDHQLIIDTATTLNLPQSKRCVGRLQRRLLLTWQIEYHQSRQPSQ